MFPDIKVIPSGAGRKYDLLFQPRLIDSPVAEITRLVLPAVTARAGRKAKASTIAKRAVDIADAVFDELMSRDAFREAPSIEECEAEASNQIEREENRRLVERRKAELRRKWEADEAQKAAPIAAEAMAPVEPVVTIDWTGEPAQGARVAEVLASKASEARERVSQALDGVQADDDDENMGD